MRIDAHHHFWDHRDLPFNWMSGPLTVLDRPFAATDFAAASTGQVEASILVEAVGREQTAQRLLFWATTSPAVVGVVVPLPGNGIADRRLSDHLRDQGRLPGAELIVGVRWSGLSDFGADWLDHPSVRSGLQVLDEHPLVLDLLVRAPEMAALARAAQARPWLHFVVDHLGKPPLTAEEHDQDKGLWRECMSLLSALPNVFVKLSGLVQRSAIKGFGDLGEPVQYVLQLFGPGRVIFGSDWPVCTTAATYDEVVVGYRRAAALSAADRELVEGGSAVAAYRLGSRVNHNSPARSPAVPVDRSRQLRAADVRLS